MQLLFLVICLWWGVHGACAGSPADSCVLATVTGVAATDGPACANIGGGGACIYTGANTGPYYPEKCIFSSGCCAKFDADCKTVCAGSGTNLHDNCKRFSPPPTKCAGYTENKAFGDEYSCETTYGCEYNGTDGKGTCKPKYKPRPCTNTKTCTDYLNFMTNFGAEFTDLLAAGGDIKALFNALVVDQEAFASVWETQATFYGGLLIGGTRADDFADECGEQLHTCLSFCARNAQFCSLLWKNYAEYWINPDLRDCIVNGTKGKCELKPIYLNCNNTWECKGVVLGLMECSVHTDPFYLANKEYCDILEGGPTGCKDFANFAANDVNWRKCVEFVTKAFGSRVGGGTVPIHLVGPIIAFHPFAPH